MRATSSRHSRWWSTATSPVWPPYTLPGVRQKVSQMDGPRRAAAPSIWKAAVAVPHKKPSGKRSSPA